MKRQIALNRTFNLYVVSGILLLLIAGACAAEKAIGGAVLFGLLGTFFLLFCLVLMPCGYLFDNEGVTIRYLFLPQERYRWDNIHAIRVAEDSAYPRSFLDLFFSGVFAITGRVEGTPRFYMNGHIRKSRRTKRLLETYWDGTVTGYLLEDAKSWLQKHRKQRQEQVREHLTDEIVPLEREARARVRTCLEPLAAQAKQHDLELHTRYVYVTEALKEWRSRPREGYTYTAIVTIARPGETDKNRQVEVSADLLFVRLGRTAYRGVENRNVENELAAMLEETLKDIREKGIEIYCENE